METLTVLPLVFGLFGMSGTLVWILRKGNNNRLTRSFILCQLSIVLWIIAQLLILFSVTDHQLWVSYIIGNVGISFFAPMWLMFSLDYISAGRKADWCRLLLPLISVTSLLLVLTNPIHHCYYARFGMSGNAYGPLFYIFQVIYYICVISGITLICIHQTREQSRINKQALLLILSIAVPLAINTLTVTKMIDIRIELTPLFFAFSSIMILIALSRYGLLNVNRIAINDTIDNIDSGVLIFDAGNKLSYCNKFAESLTEICDNSFEGFLAKADDLSGTKLKPDFLTAEVKINGKYFDLRQNYCMTKNGSRMARVITVTDVTEYRELMSAENKLSIEQERNRIAQEIHDSAGHTFTMISSLAKVLKMDLSSPDTNPASVQECLTEIDGLSRSGVTQLRCSINNLREDSFMTSITGAVNTVVGAVRNMDIDVCVQGSEDERYAFCIREVYDNVRETITNTVRYSNAERVDIIIKFLDERLEVYILDNGRGCKSINENNGLRGIRKRTENLGGTVKFSSVEDSGFSTVFKIPVRKDENNDQRDNS